MSISRRDESSRITKSQWFVSLLRSPAAVAVAITLLELVLESLRSRFRRSSRRPDTYGYEDPFHDDRF